MTADRVSLQGGYEGAMRENLAVSHEGDAASAVAKKQHGSTEALRGSNHGAFATQLSNGSTATGNTQEAVALLHSSNASGGAQFTKLTAGHEDEVSQGAAGESSAVETAAHDLISRINRA